MLDNEELQQLWQEYLVAHKIACDALALYEAARGKAKNTRDAYYDAIAYNAAARNAKLATYRKVSE